MTQTASQSVRRLREPGLLANESRQQFLDLRKEFHDEIEPCCATERFYVDWVAILTWEILRLHRIKAELINGAMFAALTNLLEQVLPAGELFSLKRDTRAEDLARRWFTDDKAMKEVAALLARLGLDEGAVEGGLPTARQRDRGPRPDDHLEGERPRRRAPIHRQAAQKSRRPLASEQCRETRGKSAANARRDGGQEWQVSDNSQPTGPTHGRAAARARPRGKRGRAAMLSSTA